MSNDFTNLDALDALAHGEEVFDVPRSNKLFSPEGENEPRYFTWKKYGFRHIMDPENPDRALCGNKPWTTMEDIRATYDFDPEDRRRPLCGNCAKNAKSKGIDCD